MNRESQARFVAVLLFLLTVAAVVFAGFNFEKERDFAAPDDGVWWVEHDGRLIADRVDPSGPGARGGIKEGDQLVAVNGEDVKSTPGLVRQLYHSGVWSKAVYSLLRQSVTLDSNVYLIPADRSLNNYLRFIALIYLGIGLYVLLRRWTATGSTHFYIFCVVSFIAYSFHYTGKFNDFDWIIYWSNIAADGRESWMSETSGQPASWGGALSLAANAQDALVQGNVSAWLYWQMSDGGATGSGNTLTGSGAGLDTAAPKYVAAKHFFRYIRPGAVRVL